MTEKEKDKIYSKMHCESNLAERIIFMFIHFIILYLIFEMIAFVFYGNELVLV